MDTFLHLIRESAYDPDVISIKITIYRLARKAKLVEYLCAAAEAGKDVTAFIELRARFDEQNNIDWSERLLPRPARTSPLSSSCAHVLTSRIISTGPSVWRTPDARSFTA